MKTNDRSKLRMVRAESPASWLMISSLVIPANSVSFPGHGIHRDVHIERPVIEEYDLGAPPDLEVIPTFQPSHLNGLMRRYLCHPSGIVHIFIFLREMWFLPQRGI